MIHFLFRTHTGMFFLSYGLAGALILIFIGERLFRKRGAASSRGLVQRSHEARGGHQNHVASQFMVFVGWETVVNPV